VKWRPPVPDPAVFAPAGCRGQLRDADVRQHRAHLRHQERRCDQALPEEIAAAVVKVLDKPTTLVSVPAALRFVSAITPTLSPKVRRWLSYKMGNDAVFLHFDGKARQSYEQRAQAAQGVVEESEKG
jgi:hypothetical protein